jgi:hypothetical protein
MIADEILRATCKIGELRAGHVDAQSLIKRGEHIAEVDGKRPRLLAAARRAQRLAGGHGLGIPAAHLSIPIEPGIR